MLLGKIINPLCRLTKYGKSLIVVCFASGAALICLVTSLTLTRVFRVKDGLCNEFHQQRQQSSHRDQRKHKEQRLNLH
ncbi:hypothetical protein C0V68_05910 [Anaplasma phagocytophilum]|nr:hypothetical protein C0V68_05910 [Anaplasma phagocytophilum]